MRALAAVALRALALLQLVHFKPIKQIQHPGHPPVDLGTGRGFAGRQIVGDGMAVIDQIGNGSQQWHLHHVTTHPPRAHARAGQQHQLARTGHHRTPPRQRIEPLAPVVKICDDRNVQQLTVEAYMNKKLTRKKSMAHVRIFLKDMSHLLGLVKV